MSTLGGEGVNEQHHSEYYNSPEKCPSLVGEKQRE